MLLCVEKWCVKVVTTVRVRGRELRPKDLYSLTFDLIWTALRRLRSSLRAACVRHCREEALLLATSAFVFVADEEGRSISDAILYYFRCRAKEVRQLRSKVVYGEGWEQRNQVRPNELECLKMCMCFPHACA